MRRVITFTIIFIVAICFSSMATVIHIPGQYSTIQQGINNSSDSDTVLVQPGIYIENINFDGHNITVGSMFLTSGDTSYISSTIIDGDSSGIVVTFENEEDNSAVLVGFSIRNGSGGMGGGILCDNNSNPAIVKNNIYNNFAGSYGAGIMCHHSSPIISENRIYDNIASYQSGGVNCSYSNAIIDRNIIWSNFADYEGGGIFCYDSQPIISNNTIVDNSTNGYGGGFCCENSNPLIINTVLWNNIAPSGPEIALRTYGGTFSTLDISFSDVQGGESGVYIDPGNQLNWNEGNIDADPLFADLENGDFHLTWVNYPIEDSTKSPCIDAGDPNSPLDPDSTIADMGALYYFHQEHFECCDVYMTPDSYPITVPQGGSFGLTGTIGNPTDEPIITDVWVGVRYMGDFLQLWYFPNLTLASGQYISAHLTQNVPHIAPLGDYEYRAHCGDLSNWVICDRDSFEFTVTGLGLSRGSDEWILEGGWDNESVIPDEYSLSANYPNPFNSTTLISFGIIRAGNVRLDIYNLMGQRVETLVNELKNAGRHSVTWDASNYSSGIYFYKLTAGDKVFTKRMTLLK